MLQPSSFHHFSSNAVLPGFLWTISPHFSWCEYRLSFCKKDSHSGRISVQHMKRLLNCVQKSLQCLWQFYLVKIHGTGSRLETISGTGVHGKRGITASESSFIKTLTCLLRSPVPSISPTILLDHCSLTNHFTFPSVLVNKSFELCSFVHHSAFIYARSCMNRIK